MSAAASLLSKKPAAKQWGKLRGFVATTSAFQRAGDYSDSEEEEEEESSTESVSLIPTHRSERPDEEPPAPLTPLSDDDSSDSPTESTNATTRRSILKSPDLSKRSERSTRRASSDSPTKALTIITEDGSRVPTAAAPSDLQPPAAEDGAATVAEVAPARDGDGDKLAAQAAVGRRGSFVQFAGGRRRSSVMKAGALPAQPSGATVTDEVDDEIMSAMVATLSSHSAQPA